jgi:hypothetical protein
MNTEKDIWVEWKEPRHFAVRVVTSTTRGYGGYRANITVGVVASSVFQAVEAVQRAYPEGRVSSVNDQGEINIIAVPISTDKNGSN